MGYDGPRGVSPGNFTNRYFCMRHGVSLANREGLIISDPDEGSAGWGLAEGARDRIRHNAEASGLTQDTLVVSSPFLRAMETAGITADSLGAGPPAVDLRLRERWFGEFDRGPHDAYRKVWERDRIDQGHRDWGVESVCDVLGRLRELLWNLEEIYTGKDILLVSHGDPTDILITWNNGTDLGKHMDVKMDTAEIRSLVQDGAS